MGTEGTCWSKKKAGTHFRQQSLTQFFLRFSSLNPFSRPWIFIFFFISGATGLIYEVVWTRLLTQVMGNTHYSIATVLTVFMAGLALGSYLGGRPIVKISLLHI